MSTATDGYAGGQQLLRDTTGQTGGTKGYVNCVSYTHTIAGADVAQFEWNNLSVLDNYATAGENVALYAQANKHSSGPTWGACIEACDTTPGDTTGLVGLEVDCWVTGADNGQRIGVDVVLGDSRVSRGMSVSGIVQGSVGLRVSSSSSAPHAQWSRAIDTTLANTPIALQVGFGQAIKCGPVNLLWLSGAALALACVAVVRGFL
jgi:hypothetical protein